MVENLVATKMKFKEFYPRGVGDFDAVEDAHLALDVSDRVYGMKRFGLGGVRIIRVGHCAKLMVGKRQCLRVGKVVVAAVGVVVAVTAAGSPGREGKKIPCSDYHERW